MTPSPIVSLPTVRNSRSGSPPHQLRVLVVDDNVLNLTVLTKLLRKRFSHLIDGGPVAVDSALKALQLLRENVFDVILMDIQMPFLSGVDCTERIRAGHDGVLEANRHATIIAVTTATGKEPEEVYRKAGFDGIIGKPVKAQVMQEFLVPLHAAARDAAAQTPMAEIDGQQVLPAVPMTPLTGHRVFYLPSVHRDSPNAPDITLSADFETLLKEQTRASLKRFGAYAISRTGTVSGASDRRRLREYDNVQSDDSSSEGSPPLSASISTDGVTLLDVDSPSLGTAELPRRAVEAQHDDHTHSDKRPNIHRRQASLTISQSRLQHQLQQEMDAAHLGKSTDSDTDDHDAFETIREGRTNGKTRQRPSLVIASRHSTPDVFALDDWRNLWDTESGVEDQPNKALENMVNGYNMMTTLSPLASPSRRSTLLPPTMIASLKAMAEQQQQEGLSPVPLRRPGARPRQQPRTPDRRRSSADQSTSSEVSDSTGSSSSRFGPSSTDRSDSAITEAEEEEEFDSPLTSPETEYPPSQDNDVGATTVDEYFCPYQLDKSLLEEDSAMMPAKCQYLDDHDCSPHEIYDPGGLTT